MSDMQVFSNPQFGNIRTVTIEEEPWFVGKDVALVLGYSNTRDALIRHIDSEDKRASEFPTPSGTQEMTIINESGLYSLIMSSKLPGAKQFKRWVTSEVLPAIRRAGSYSMQSAPVLSPAQLIAAQAQLLVDMEQKMAHVEARQAVLSEKVDQAVKAFSRPSGDHWKSDMDIAIKDLCAERRLSVTATKGRMYNDLEQKCGCDVNARLANLRKRSKKQGARHKDAMALTKLDAIASDKQLRAAFELVVKEWQARSFTLEGQEAIVVQETISL